MRGQAWLKAAAEERGRITPADAGTSVQDGCGKNPRKDHPRGCGDKWHPAQTRLRAGGSPPRMRGQDQMGYSTVSMRRITPADAGTSTSRTAWRLWCGDHPRGCGDKLNFLFQVGGVEGSPPRMRGQVLLSCVSSFFSRITPADAGTSLFLFASFAIVRDHPRGCGDKLICGFALCDCNGSPPRMRGQVFL